MGYIFAKLERNLRKSEETGLRMSLPDIKEVDHQGQRASACVDRAEESLFCDLAAALSSEWNETDLVKVW